MPPFYKNLLVTDELKDLLVTKGLGEKNQDDEYYRRKTFEAVEAGKLTVTHPVVHDAALSGAKEASDGKRAEAKLLIKEAVGEMLGGTRPAGTGGTDPATVFGGVRVKAGSESYSTAKSIAKHRKFNFTPRDEKGQEVLTTSELEHAKMGVWFKNLARRAGIPVIMTEGEQSLMHEMVEKDVWVGKVESEWKKNVSGMTVKALLSDATSGGLEINPEWFDSRLISFPLLTAELAPFVDLQEVPRGASVEGASIQTPTMTWGTPSGTAMPLFNTDAMVAELNTSIHVVSCVIEVGRDFASDAAVDIGRVLESLLSERFSAELDRVIANGNGTNEPTGIMSASGLNSVTFGGTATTVDDVEALLFGIGKQYRKSQRCAFVSNDTNYQRIRSIPVGGSDARRIFGMSHEDYQVFNRRWAIQEDIANTHAAFGDLGKYRFYRRLGYTQEIVTNDMTLVRQNKIGIVVRGRFGGRVMDPNAFARTTDALAS
jgi:HK97 family phage major capsid protein